MSACTWLRFKWRGVKQRRYDKPVHAPVAFQQQSINSGRMNDVEFNTPKSCSSQTTITFCTSSENHKFILRYLHTVRMNGLDVIPHKQLEASLSRKMLSLKDTGDAQRNRDMINKAASLASEFYDRIRTFNVGAVSKAKMSFMTSKSTWPKTWSTWCSTLKT